MTASILIVGDDPVLLHTRAELRCGGLCIAAGDILHLAVGDHHDAREALPSCCGIGRS